MQSSAQVRPVASSTVYRLLLNRHPTILEMPPFQASTLRAATYENVLILVLMEQRGRSAFCPLSTFNDVPNKSDTSTEDEGIEHARVPAAEPLRGRKLGVVDRKSVV